MDIIVINAMHIISLGAPRAVDPVERNQENLAVPVQEWIRRLCLTIHEAGSVSVIRHPSWKSLRPYGDHMQALCAIRFGATPDCAAYLGSTEADTYSINPICGKHFTMGFSEDCSKIHILDAIRQRHSVTIQLNDDYKIA